MTWRMMSGWGGCLVSPAHVRVSHGERFTGLQGGVMTGNLTSLRPESRRSWQVALLNDHECMVTQENQVNADLKLCLCVRYLLGTDGIIISADFAHKLTC